MNSTILNPLLVGLLLGITLLITSLGFRNLVHFISIGYAFAIVGLALAGALLFLSNLSAFSILHYALLIVWGLRLGLFLVRRERKPGYQAAKANVERTYGRAPLPVKFAIWISVSILYVLMFSPALFHSARPNDTSPSSLIWQGLGLLVALAGLGIETLADQQKAAAKHKNPSAFCASGLYGWVRCPNYFGEIAFWTGSWIMAIPFYLDPLGWIAGLVGEIVIVLIMFGSARRLEGNQLKRYGHLEAYQAYIQRVPVLVPYVPVYSLQKARILPG